MPAWHRPCSVAGEAGPGEHRRSSCGRFNPFPRLGWPRRNAVGLPGVKLDAASVAPPQGGCCSSTRHLGGNVYLPREWAFGITPGDQPVPLCGTPFHAFMSRTRIGVSGTGRREVPGRPQARLPGAGRPGTGKPSAGTGRGSRAKIRLPIVDIDADLAEKRIVSGTTDWVRKTPRRPRIHNGRTISERHHRTPQ